MSRLAFTIENLARIVRELGPEDVGDYPNPMPPATRHATEHLIHRLESLLFPFEHPWEEAVEASRTAARLELLGRIIWDLTHQIHRIRPHECQGDPCTGLSEAFDLAQQFSQKLPEVQRLLYLDADAAYQGDPAARNRSEVLSTYPGLYAIMVYRLAHVLFTLDVPLLPRLMTEIAHSQTGIDIHPGAHIGSSFFIDHGTGVVIGETAEVGDQVTLYQGVTLGALNFPRDLQGQIIRGQKRHPTIGNRVVIYSGATILGGTTTVGAGSVIGGGVWLTTSVPENSRVMTQPLVDVKKAAPKTSKPLK
ncbi:MAG: serine acetyltransferase [Sulfobacillus thermosulfidooxidans]|uniref:Serine acetyltransferase n=1 Tax=Sulfobacillus thermotolerans TaxID=338644 RepID=A0ABM6RVI2_9FIRM|nr:serine O-acetyltransferase EpsC [Sulfobacillus sp. hq2]AUW95385.1 serine acetyltransferase [Sulfobacillus thermotolerans]MCY0906915.1 serine acetyltransferase [Sulfobacillus thermotolerans]POB11735.1 serine acetyltransferase [Sulfobacillus sp. hq2]PSR36394.1 MAG: serine acetyltransferase [Sulfobacillus thermosulfidooxidans]